MEEGRISLNKYYWENRYLKEEIGWDIGEISRPLKSYFDQLENKSLKILIPGCGNGHEAEYLFKKGFNNVYVADFSETALSNFKSRVPSFEDNHLICDDFFNLSGKYDIIIEQTFFCALNPKLRSDYVKKVSSLLNQSGKLVGLLFNDSLNSDKPPFGGNINDYKKLFSEHLLIETMEKCYNSIEPRNGRELFIKMVKNA